MDFCNIFALSKGVSSQNPGRPIGGQAGGPPVVPVTMIHSSFIWVTGGR